MRSAFWSAKCDALPLRRALWSAESEASKDDKITISRTSMLNSDCELNYINIVFIIIKPIFAPELLTLRASYESSS